MLGCVPNKQTTPKWLNTYFCISHFMATLRRTQNVRKIALQSKWIHSFRLFTLVVFTFCFCFCTLLLNYNFKYNCYCYYGIPVQTVNFQTSSELLTLIKCDCLSHFLSVYDKCIEMKQCNVSTNFCPNIKNGTKQLLYWNRNAVRLSFYLSKNIHPHEPAFVVTKNEYNEECQMSRCANNFISNFV